MRRHFVREKRTGKDLIWKVSVSENKVRVEWGEITGAVLETTQSFEAVNVGKSNEKSKEIVALEWAERRILMKRRGGFREVDLTTNAFIEDLAPDAILFDENLPENLRFYKPQNSLNSFLRKKMASKEVWYVRKRDGNMHSSVTTADGPVLYTSTTQRYHKDEPGVDLYERYPGIKAGVESLSMGPESILLGELVTGFDEDDIGFEMDNLEYVNGVRGSKLQEALDKQAADGELSYCAWDIAFLDGECLLETKTYRERFELLSKIIDESGTDHITLPEVMIQNDSGSFDVFKNGHNRIHFELDEDDSDPEYEATKIAKKLNWEGWVVVDPDTLYGDKAYGFRGKAERPKAIAKLKPKLEADFIVKWDPDNGIGKWGKGSRSDSVGSVQSYLLDEDGREIEVSLVGGGLTTVRNKKTGAEADIERFADPSLYPMVWQVEFASWTKKGSIQFGEFIRVRDDKQLNECSIEQNPDWETTSWK